MEKLKSRYYSVKQIKEMENCGRDKAYDIAKQLPHEKRGRDIYVFAEDYENYYKEKRQKCLNKSEIKINNVFQIRKFS